MKIIFAFLFLLWEPVFAQYQQWGNLQPGPYAIGYKMIVVTDSSRYYRDGFEPFVLNKNGKQFRKLALYVWYPAKKNDVNKFMSYGDYFPDLKYERPDDDNPTIAAQQILQQLKRSFNIEDSLFSAAAKVKIPVEQNAEPLLQKFPVVLHTHAIGLLFQTIFTEFLASHGYIVVSYPRLGVEPVHYGWNDSSPAEEVTSADDVGFVISKLKNIAGYADIGNISFVGNLAEKGVNHQFKNGDLSAIVCLSGSFGEWIKTMPYYNQKKFRIPLLQIRESHRNDQPLFLDSLKYSSRWLIQFKQLGHTDFYPFDKVFHFQESKKWMNYEYVAQLTLEFLDAIQKKKSTHIQFSSVPDSLLLSIAAKPALEPLPTENEFLSWIKNDDLETAKKYTSVSQPVFSSNAMRGLLTNLSWLDKPYTVDAVKIYLDNYPEDPRESFEYIFRVAGSEKIATGIFQILTEKFPRSPYPYDGLSDYYDNLGDVQNKKRYAQQALTLASGDSGISSDQRDKLIQKLQAKSK